MGVGEWLLLDFGAEVDGYCADITRTVVVGARATERQRALYELVAEAQQRARTGVRAGMTGRDVDALARELIAARGLGDAFGHSLGHGLGLQVHEAPRLSKTSDEPLPVGAVVTIEPGVYLAGQSGVRIEDDVYLGEDLFRLRFPLAPGESESAPVAVTITLMAESYDRLHWSCTACESLCEHIGAALFFVRCSEALGVPGARGEGNSSARLAVDSPATMIARPSATSSLGHL